MDEPQTTAAPEATSLPDPVICYVLVRVDAPDFNLGKVCAQVHHNGCQFVETMFANRDNTELWALYEEWKEDRLFGTVLTLPTTAAELRQIVLFADILNGKDGQVLHAGLTHDPTYPMRYNDGGQVCFVTAPVDTVGFVFGRKSTCQRLLAMKNLLSERDVYADARLKDRP